MRLAVLSVVLVYLLVRGPDPDSPYREYRDVLLMVATGFAVGLGIVIGIVAAARRVALCVARSAWSPTTA